MIRFFESPREFQMRLALVAVVAASVGLTACESRQQQGTATGAVAGALIGSAFGGGTGERVAAAALGAVIGGLIGNQIGRDLDEQDRRRAFLAEEATYIEGRRTEWRGERAYGYVEPGPTSRRGALFCREYTHTIIVGGRQQTAVGTACRNPDGTWSPTA